MKAGNTRVHGKGSADADADADADVTGVTDRLERELQRRQEERMPGVPLRVWARGLLARSPRRAGEH
ncbi:hypothetical protein ACFYPC_04170 [Streptomyces sp. NPDC005808]|uniref:hypothetical protein n=1 Tax=Streptomyces sp. NPDC005808 TaxID=3364734 RepID=UPI0036A68D42